MQPLHLERGAGVPSIPRRVQDRTWPGTKLAALARRRAPEMAEHHRPKCGIGKSDWSENGGTGYRRDRTGLCCRGCVPDTGCTCRG